MYGEVIDALLRLLEERLAKQLPGDALHTAARLLQTLIDGDRTDLRYQNVRLLTSLCMARMLRRSIPRTITTSGTREMLVTGTLLQVRLWQEHAEGFQWTTEHMTDMQESSVQLALAQGNCA